MGDGGDVQEVVGLTDTLGKWHRYVVAPDPSLSLRGGIQQSALDKQEPLRDPRQPLRVRLVGLSVFRSLLELVGEDTILINGRCQHQILCFGLNLYVSIGL